MIQCWLLNITQGYSAVFVILPATSGPAGVQAAAHLTTSWWGPGTSQQTRTFKTNNYYIIHSQLTHSHMTNNLPPLVTFNNQLPIWVSTSSWRHITRVEVQFCAFSTSAIDGNEKGVEHSLAGHCGKNKNQILPELNVSYQACSPVTSLSGLR